MAPAYLIRFKFIINRHTDAKNNYEIFLKKNIFKKIMGPANNEEAGEIGATVQLQSCD